MTEYEDKRIVSFFEEYARKEIADDGFSQRVMRSLPSHDYVYKQRLNRIWTAVCALAAVVLFVRPERHCRRLRCRRVHVYHVDRCERSVAFDGGHDTPHFCICGYIQHTHVRQLAFFESLKV